MISLVNEFSVGMAERLNFRGNIARISRQDSLDRVQSGVVLATHDLQLRQANPRLQQSRLKRNRLLELLPCRLRAVWPMARQISPAELDAADSK
jgi:hypothetical protein